MRSGALVLIGGQAGAGKSHVSQSLARQLDGAVLLDKDTLTRAFAERLLIELGRSPHDRESVPYREHVRPLEYSTLMDVAWENVSAAKTVLAVAPFAAELADPEWLARTIERAARHGAGLGLIWITADGDTAHERMARRGDGRDTWKRANWSHYQSTILFDVPAAAALALAPFVIQIRSGSDLESTVLHAVSFIQGLTIAFRQDTPSSAGDDRVPGISPLR